MFIERNTQNQYSDNYSENVDESFSSNEEIKPTTLILENKFRERITITPIKQNNSIVIENNAKQKNLKKNSKQSNKNENYSEEPQDRIRDNKFRQNHLFKESINVNNNNFDNNCCSGHFCQEVEKEPKNSERVDNIKFPNQLPESNNLNYINNKNIENNKNNINNINNIEKFTNINQNDNDYFEDNIQYNQPLENDNSESNNFRESKIINNQINIQDNIQKDIFNESANYNNINFYISDNNKKEKNNNNSYENQNNNYNDYQKITNYTDINLYNKNSLDNFENSENFIKQEKKQLKNEDTNIINQNDPSIIFSDLKPKYIFQKLKTEKKTISNKNSEIIDAESPRDNYRKKIKIITLNNNNFKPNFESSSNSRNSNDNSITHKISKLNNSYGANNRNKKKFSKNYNKIKIGGERLYSEYLIHLPYKQQRLENLKKELEYEKTKELSFHPKINANSKKMAERKNSLKVEDRLIFYGNQKKQNNLISKINQDLKNTMEYTYSPKIDEVSRFIAETNRKNRNKCDLDLKNKKKIKEKIDLQAKFDKKTRSLSNSRKKHKKLKNKLLNEYIDFDGNKNENNITEDEERIINKNNKLNKISNLNKTFNELNNSLDEKEDHEITKFFSDRKIESDLHDQKNIHKNNEKYFFVNEKHSINKNYKDFKPENNIFDVLYLESNKQNEKKLKNKEIFENETRKNNIQPKISPYPKQLKENNKESKKEFYDRISKKLERIQKEVKLINSSKSKSIANSKNNSPKMQDIKDKKSKHNEHERKNNENKLKLMKIEQQNNKEKKEIFNEKSKEIIMKMKIAKYKQLFDLLDSDNDGLISYNNIKLTKIDEQTLNSLSPIFDYLHNSGNNMDFREFCIKFDKTLTDQKLNSNERSDK